MRFAIGGADARVVYKLEDRCELLEISSYQLYT